MSSSVSLSVFLRRLLHPQFWWYPQTRLFSRNLTGSSLFVTMENWDRAFLSSESSQDDVTTDYGSESSMSIDSLLDSSSDDELLGDEDEEIVAVLAVVFAAIQTQRLFSANELANDFQQSVNTNVGVRDVLSTMTATPSMFKTLTNFTVQEF